MPDLHPVRRALLSVSDKTGLVEFARGLAELGVELLYPDYRSGLKALFAQEMSG